MKKKSLMGRKLGMTNLFNETGHMVVCTVVKLDEPNIIVQVKNKEKDGYEAIQVGYSKITTKDPRTVEKRVKKPVLGHFKKAGVEPRRYLAETTIEPDEKPEVGQEFGVEIFKDTKYLDVSGTSIGKGFAGAMKLYNFRGAPASHGAKKNHRSLGSTGSLTPTRCLPGGKRASRMGGRKVTVQGLEIVQIDEEEQVVVIKGAIPGPKNGIVTLRPAVKKIGVNS